MDTKNEYLATKAANGENTLLDGKPMQVPEYFAYQRAIVNNRTEIIALNLKVESLLIDPNCDLRIIADTINLPAGTLSLPGKNITMQARVINCNGCTIDVSGNGFDTEVLHIIPSKASSAVYPSSPGAPGKSGGATNDTIANDGKKSGSVSIFAGQINGQLKVLAKGGKGQRGQDGQDGGDGKEGFDGRDAVIGFGHDGQQTGLIYQATPGGNGGSGGNGGNAGKSGDGGDGGKIEILSLSPVTGSNIQCYCDGGKGGEVTKPGKGGKGSPAGIGGRIAEESYVGQHMHQRIWIFPGKRMGGAVNGPDGKDGSTAEPSKDGAAGTSNVVTVTDISKTISYDSFQLAQIALAFHQAEISYLAYDFQNTKDIYNWINTITKPASGDLAGEYSALNTKALYFLNQLNQGVDFFGNPVNYVPVVALSTYRTFLSDMLKFGKDIEDIYREYTAALQTQQKQFDKFNKFIELADTAIKNYTKESEQLSASLDSIYSTAQQIGDQRDKQRAIMERAGEEFKSAVQRKTEGCTFGEVLSIVSTVVSLGTSAFKIAQGIGTITDLVQKDVAAVEDFKKGIETVKVIADSSASIYKTIGATWNKSIKPLNVPETPDKAKIAMEEEKFDDAIKPYLDMSEAQNYKNQVHAYIELVKAYNAKMMEFTSALNRIGKLKAMTDIKQKQMDRIKGDRAAIANPMLAPYSTFVYSLYQDARITCLEYLYRENQAYKYWSLDDSEFKVSDNTFADLEAFSLNLDKNILDKIQIATSPQQEFDDFKICISEGDTPGGKAQFDQFRANGTISFNIPLDENVFKGWARVMATKFKVYIPNAVTGEADNQLFIHIYHQGKVSIMDGKLKRHDFCHDQVFAAYEYKIVKDETGKFVIVKVAGGDLGGGGSSDYERIALSPFAAWTIYIPKELNKGLDLSNVNEITIALSGYAVPVKMQGGNKN